MAKERKFGPVFDNPMEVMCLREKIAVRIYQINYNLEAVKDALILKFNENGFSREAFDKLELIRLRCQELCDNFKCLNFSNEEILSTLFSSSKSFKSEEELSKLLLSLDKIHQDLQSVREFDSDL